jgi:ribonuclease R
LIFFIIRKHQLPEAFQKKLVEERSDYITDEEIIQQDGGFARLNIVTIDGEDAKDLDDAVNERLRMATSWVFIR